MTRSWSAQALWALAQSNVPLVLLAQADFSGGTIRLCSLPYDIVVGGYVYTGLGSLLEIGELAEETSVLATGMVVRLSAISDSLLAIAYNQQYQGRAFRMWACPLDQSGAYTDVRLVYQGYMDTMAVDDGAGTITLTVEHALARLNRPPAGYYNDSDLQTRFAGDRGLEFVASLEKDTEIVWGNA